MRERKRERERDAEHGRKVNENGEYVEGRRQTQTDIYLIRRGAGKMEETGGGIEGR